MEEETPEYLPPSVCVPPAADNKPERSGRDKGKGRATVEEDVLEYLPSAAYVPPSPANKPKHSGQASSSGHKTTATDNKPKRSVPDSSSSHKSKETGPQLPSRIISSWSDIQCAEFLAVLGLHQYSSKFLATSIAGNDLIALDLEDLRAMGIASVSHRLTILKKVYDIKIKHNVPIQASDYIPSSATTVEALVDALVESEVQSSKEISKVNNKLFDYEHELKLCHERIGFLEQEVTRMEQHLNRMTQRLNAQADRVEEVQEHVVIAMRMSSRGTPTMPPPRRY